MTTDRAVRLAAQLQEACVHDLLVGVADVSVTILDNTLAVMGTVATAAARQRVGELAAGLAPDLVIDNALVVGGTGIPDDDVLSQRANAWVARRYGEHAAGLGVEVRHGKAILRGVWRHVAAVREARDAIGALAGVAEVDTAHVTLPHVTRLPEVGDVPLDQTSVINQLELAMAKTGYRLGDWVDARMVAGAVELFGVVDGEREMTLVTEIAAGIPGVRKVDNRLATRQQARQGGRRAEARIRRRWGRPGDSVTPVAVQVFVVDDHAYVQGQVDTPEAKVQALAMVQQDPAIRHVHDWIKVVTRRSRPDTLTG